MSGATCGTSRGVDQERLQHAPEIPVLIAVTNAVDLAIAVLRIQHPSLAGGAAVEAVHDAPPVVLAEFVRLHGMALRAAIERYREVMAPFPFLPGDDDDYF